MEEQIENIKEPKGLHTLTIFVVSLSALFTVIGFSNILIWLFHICRPLRKFKKWWPKNMARDMLVDQFSWTSVVITACIAGANGESPYWSGSLIAVLHQTKKYVLDWFVDDESGSTMDTFKGVFWAVSVVALALKIFCCCCMKKGGLSGVILTIVCFVQHVCSALGIILLPLIFHCVGQMDADSTMDYFSIFFTILLFMTQVGSFHGNCIYGIVAAFVTIFLPVSLCLTCGIGKSDYKEMLNLALAFTIILGILTTNSLFLAFFYNAKNKNWRWRICAIIAIIIRVAALICGVLFLVLLRFHINKDTNNFCIFLWIMWIVVPFFGVIPLIFAARPVMEKVDAGSMKKKLLG